MNQNEHPNGGSMTQSHMNENGHPDGGREYHIIANERKVSLNMNKNGHLDGGLESIT